MYSQPNSKILCSVYFSLISQHVSHHKLSGNSSRKLVKKKTVKRFSGHVSKSAANQTIAEKTLMISEYFVAQLFLAADLCLDRNYVSMGLLESSFPYVLLLSMLKMPTTSPLIKAPVCRLIRCLYVDREPQMVIKYPRLVKTTQPSSGSQGDSDSDSDSDSGNNSGRKDDTPKSSYTFGVLQIIISEFLHHGLDATQCNELSSEMMDTLLCLIQFGFYDSPEQLQDIISPLVQALDDHYLNRSRDIGNLGMKKKSSMILLQEKVVEKKTTLFDSKKSIAPKEEDGSGAVDSRSSSRVHVNFRHTRRTLNEAMYMSLSNQARSKDKDALSDASRKNILSATSMDTKVDVNKVPVELKILRVLESLPGLVLILTIVIIGTIFATVQILSGQEHNQSTYIFELSLSTLFFVELTVRSYCYFVVHKELKSFVSEPLNILDILLVVFDICLIAFDTTILGGADGAKSYAKTLK